MTTSKLWPLLFTAQHLGDTPEAPKVIIPGWRMPNKVWEKKRRRRKIAKLARKKQRR